MAVTDKDVIWCYRSLLGRAPESQQTIQNLIRSADDFRSLVLLFLGSPEYRASNSHGGLVPLADGQMDVNITASSAELERLQERIRAAWTHLGAARPHHSVLTADDYLAESINERSIEKFYESGKGDAAVIDSMLSRHGFSAPAGTCVEYGCGLGRVTFYLAQRFATVHAYDISSNHIALARKRALDHGVRNVEFHLCEIGVGDQNLQPCDFFFSCIVFQHNPPPIIHAMISSALRSLRPGGVAIFQVPTFGLDYRFSLQDYLASEPHLDIEMHCIPQQAVFALIAEHGCTLLEVREDGWVGSPGRWISNTFIIRR